MGLFNYDICILLYSRIIQKPKFQPFNSSFNLKPMKKIIGIRREDKNIWEKRVPLIPEDVKSLLTKNELEIVIQPSSIRIFPDKSFRESGAQISESLHDADIILGVKEIPVEFFEENKTYIFFSHTIKGQSYNMDMLKQMIKQKCNLIDYEKIINENNQRLIFFGKYAGIAGMIEVFHALGEKLKLRGFSSPFKKIKQAFLYSTVDEAIHHVQAIGSELNEDGLDKNIGPLVFGFAGYGNVSLGAQDIFNHLPHQTISPEDLVQNFNSLNSQNGMLYKVVFKEEHIAAPIDGKFNLSDYYKNPDIYEGIFSKWLPYITVLVNCIHWTKKYPRLLTKDYLTQHPNGKLLVIGDISCDINGSIEITHKSTFPDSPTYTYFPTKNQFKDGNYPEGVTVMAIDNLPSEFSKEASTDFSKVLKNFIPNILKTNFKDSFDDLNLPLPINNGLILHQGKFTEDYMYMNNFIRKEAA